MQQHNNELYRKRIIEVVLFLLFLFGLSVTYLMLSHNRLLKIPCAFYEITNLCCPGCGMTRAFYCLITLDFAGCFHNNLLVFLLIPTGLYYLYHLIRHYLLKGKIISITTIFSKKFLIVLLVITILYGIIRNFQYFDWMQPLK